MPRACTAPRRIRGWLWSVAWTRGADCRLPDELECPDGLLPDIITRLVECCNQRTNGRFPDLAEGIGRTAPDNPVLILEAVDKGLDERLAKVPDGTHCCPAGIEVALVESPQEIVCPLLLRTEAYLIPFTTLLLFTLPRFQDIAEFIDNAHNDSRTNISIKSFK